MMRKTVRRSSFRRLSILGLICVLLVSLMLVGGCEDEEEAVEGGPYTLTMAVSGSGSTDPSVGAHTYDEGEVVSITATPADGWEFDGWTGDVADANSASTSVTMDKNKTVTAKFTEVEAIVWKLTHYTPETSTRGIAANKFAELVEEYTDGRLEIEVYPNAILYTTATEWEATMTGAVDVLMTSSYFALSYLPYLSINYLEGFWEDNEHYRRWVANALLNAKIREDLEENNLYHLGLLSSALGSGYHCSGIVTCREDMAGMRYGLRTGATMTPMVLYNDVEVIEVSPAEMNSSLATGIIDVFGGGVTIAATQKIWEFGARSELVGVGGVYCDVFEVNLDAWNSLPSDIQDIIENEVMPEMLEFCYDSAVAEFDSAIETLEEHLEVVTLETREEAVAIWEVIEEYELTQTLLARAGTELEEEANAIRPSRD